MIKMHRLICTCLGIGYIEKGSGTMAALVTAVLWYLICSGGCNLSFQIGLLLVVLIGGVWSAGKVEAAWGKDSSRVVIDEVAGMMVSLLFIPAQVKYTVTAFVLFRFFDIAKPLFIRRLEKLPGGWGVMADDVAAGLYANAIMQLVLLFHIF